MDFLSFSTIPANSISILHEADRYNYIQKTIKLPEKIRNMMFSEETGAYVRGLGSSYDINTDLVPKIALTILKIALREKLISSLPTILSAELQISNEVAQKMALEIKHDLFESTKEELGESLQQEKLSTNLRTQAEPFITPKNNQGIINLNPQPKKNQNILNLKELTTPKQQKQLPKTISRQQLPKGSLETKPTSAPKFPLPPRPSTPPATPIKPLSFI